jgi:hypothetical protein
MIYLKRHTTLDWPNARRPAPDRLAARLASALQEAGYRTVTRDHATVTFGNRSWIGSNWNPLTYVGTGIVSITQTPSGFVFHCSLGTGRLLFVLLWAAFGGTLLGLGGGVPGLVTWGPLIWLLGVGGAGALLMVLVGVPNSLTRFVTPPSDEVPWTPD